MLREGSPTVSNHLPDAGILRGVTADLKSASAEPALGPLAQGAHVLCQELRGDRLRSTQEDMRPKGLVPIRTFWLV